MAKTISLTRAESLLKLAIALSDLMFMTPVIFIIYQSKGLSVGDVFMLRSLFFITMLLIEIPTGYIGDIFSRKQIIVLSMCSYCLCNIILFFGSGFFAMMMVEMCIALCVAMRSGTVDAYLYDILKKQSKEQHYGESFGSYTMWHIGASGLATLAGGFIFYNLGSNYTILLQLLFGLLGLSVSMLLPNISEARRVEEGKSKLRDLKGICSYATNHAELKWLFVFPIAVGGPTLIMFLTMQPIMEHNLVPVALFGLFISFGHACRAAMAKYADVILQKLKIRKFVIFLSGGTCIGLTITAILPSISNIHLTFVLLTLVGLSYGCFTAVMVVNRTLISHRIRSKERATVLSIESMVQSLFCAFILLVMKFLIDKFDVQTAVLMVLPFVIVNTYFVVKNVLKLEMQMK